jgi:RNA polymerase sigma factor (sigma-70 family)
VSERRSGAGDSHDALSEEDDRRDDQQVLAALRSGQDGAWATLWLRHYSWLRGYVGGYLRADSEAEDVASEALMRTLARFSVLDPPRSLRSYLKTVARHLVIDLYRRRDRETEAVQRARGDLVVWDEPSLSVDERRRVVRTLRAMPERQRYVLIRLILDGMSITEVADEFGLSPNATSQLAFRARATFRRLFGDYGGFRLALATARRRLTSRTRVGHEGRGRLT